VPGVPPNKHRSVAPLREAMMYQVECSPIEISDRVHRTTPDGSGFVVVAFDFIGISAAFGPSIGAKKYLTAVLTGAIDLRSQ
jgi:hypothetical protein